jgi:hypothetical protein
MNVAHRRILARKLTPVAFSPLCQSASVKLLIGLSVAFPRAATARISGAACRYAKAAHSG